MLGIQLLAMFLRRPLVLKSLCWVFCLSFATTPAILYWGWPFVLNMFELGILCLFSPNCWFLQSLIICERYSTCALLLHVCWLLLRTTTCVEYYVLGILCVDYYMLHISTVTVLHTEHSPNISSFKMYLLY